MMENKQGMSAVVTTLIIILLVIVALGIIWVVVKNVIQGGVEQVDLSTKCREVEVSATKLNETETGNYSITLSRTGTGEDVIGGIRLVLANTATSTYSDPFEFGEALTPLKTETIDFIDTGVDNANQLEMTVYFVNDLGETEICPITVTEEF